MSAAAFSTWTLKVSLLVISPKLKPRIFPSVVLEDDALVQAFGILLGPGVEHLRAGGDQLPRQGDEGPVVLGLETVAVVLLPVQRLAGIGGELLCLVDIVGILCLLEEQEAVGKLRLQQGLVPVGDAAQQKVVIHGGGILPQGVDRRAQRAAADGIDEGRQAVQAHLGQRALPKVTDELTIMLVPDIHVAEVEVRAGGILTPQVAVNPFLVQQGDRVESDHRYTLSQTALISFLKLRRSINASGRLLTSRSRAEG